MQYRFIHHWQYEPGVQENLVLEQAISLLSKEQEDNFLNELAAFIAVHTGAKYVLIGLLTDNAEKAQTCVFLQDREVMGNITYALQGTPCADVVTQQFCYFPMHVLNYFPSDNELQQLGIESYLGSILLSETGEPIGLIALMDEKPLENAAFAEHLILVLSPALEEELAKLKAKATMQVSY